jgi:hypothetical protein
MTKQTLLYLDNSVLTPIAEQAAAGRIRALFKANGAVNFASTQNLVEAWRTPDEAIRTKRVWTLLRVAHQHEEDALQYQAVRRVAKQIRLHHPEWIGSWPKPALIEQYRQVRIDVWNRLETDPSYVSPEMVAFDSELRKHVGDSMQIQRKKRALVRGGTKLPLPTADPAITARLEPLVANLSEPESFWRVQTAASWWNAIFKGDPQRRDIREWLQPYLNLQRLDVEAWERFWIAEVDASAVAVVQIKGLIDYFQGDYKVESGNWGDINHAGFAVGRDCLLTADHDFYQALTKAKAELGAAMAQPVFVNRAAPDIRAEIESVLGW